MEFADKCSYHSSSKKHLITANGDHQRKPQLDTVQRETIMKSLAPTSAST